MVYANDLIIEWLLKKQLILNSQKEQYAKLIVDSIMKNYYAIIVSNNIYFEAKDVYSIPQKSYIIVNSIAKSTRHPILVVTYTLLALSGLVKEGKVPNNWLYPSQSVAMQNLKFLESNPNYITSLLKFFTDTITPTITTAKEGTTDFIDKIKFPLLLSAIIIVVLKFKK